MSFSKIQNFLDKIAKEYNITQYNMVIYHNNINVFSCKKNKNFFKNKDNHLFKTNPKIMACLSIIMLSVTGKVSLNDSVKKYVSDFPGSDNLEDLINNYFKTVEIELELNYFEIMSQIVEKTTKIDIIEYSKLMIIEPMKLNSTTINTNDLITNSRDYLKFCGNICNIGAHLSKYKELKKSINILSEILINYQNSYFSYIDINGLYTLIDVHHKIFAVYNHCNTNTNIFKTLQSLIYDSCINQSFFNGYNLFP